MDIREALEYPLPMLTLSATEITMEGKDEVAFSLKNSGGGLLIGQILSPTNSLTFTPNKWEGNRQNIKCHFSPDPLEGWKPGDVREFEITVLSNGGEKIIPVTVKLAKMAINTTEGTVIANLRYFFDYAQRHPSKAQAIFVSKDFSDLLRTTDYAYLDAYEWLAKESNRARALDNFFVLSGLKGKTLLTAPQTAIEHVGKIDDDSPIEGVFELQKSDNGYYETRLLTKRNAEWLSLQKEHLSNNDFDDNIATVKYKIAPSLVQGRYAKETIIAGESAVDIVFKRPAPMRCWLTREGFRLYDEGILVVETPAPIMVEVFCKEQFVRFVGKEFRVLGREEIRFTIKPSAFQSAQMMFRKQPSLSAEIEVRAFYNGTVVKRVLPLTAGEW